jgi:hypothetical protein
MSKFTFRIVNHRDKDDEPQLNLLLTSTSSAGLQGIELAKSTSLADFFSLNPSHSFSAEKLVGSRLYVGYGAMPRRPTRTAISITAGSNSAEIPMPTRACG